MQLLALSTSPMDIWQGEPRESLRTIEYWTHLFCKRIGVLDNIFLKTKERDESESAKKM